MEHEYEREQERMRYRLCLAGFGFVTVALVVASLATLIVLPSLFHGKRMMPWLQESWLWKWSDAPVVWGCLIGWYLLWGRWSHPGWQRRTGFLVIMGVVDLALWLIDHGADLGLRLDDVGHAWFRYNLGHALGWAELALMAGLAGDVLVHLDIPRAAETSKSTRALASTGASLWMLLFCLQTNWAKGWPLRFRPIMTLETFLLHLGSTMILTIVLIQVTALTIAAARQCLTAIRQMDQDDHESDPLRSASEQA